MPRLRSARPPGLPLASKALFGLTIFVVLVFVWRAHNEWSDARAHVRFAARQAGVLDEHATALWVRADQDSVRTDGVATFEVPAQAIDALAARVTRALGPERPALDPEGRAELERVARRFDLPAELDPMQVEDLQIHAGETSWLLGRDFALLSRERGRAWFFRAVRPD